MKQYFARHSLIRALAGLALCLALVAPPRRAAAQQPKVQSPTNWFVGGGGPGPAPAEAKSVTVVEHLGAAIPLDLSFIDDQGQPVQLKQYFGTMKPVVLQLGYYGCPMLCNLVSQGLVNSLKDVQLNAGTDYEVVYVSIDPNEGPGMARQKKDAYVEAYGRPGAQAGWHLLTGKKDQIDQLAQAVGFQYKWIDSAQQYSHPAVLMVAMPDGRVARYLYGVRFDAPIVRLSLVEAADGKIGNTVDRFVLTCFQYDGTVGKYALAAVKLMRAGGVLTTLLLGGTMFWLFRRESRRGASSRAGRQVASGADSSKESE